MLTSGNKRYMMGFLCLLAFIVLLYPAAAEDIFIKQSTVYDLKRPCFNNGTYCDSSFACNFSMFLPNGTTVINNQEMTNQVSFHNITLSAVDTQIKGTHAATMICTDGSESGSDTFEILINPVGLKPTDQRSNTLLLTVIFMGVISLFLFLAGFKMEFTPLKWSFYIMGMLSILIAINVMFVTMQDEIVNPNIEGLFDTVVASTFFLYWGAGVSILLIWMVTVILNIGGSKKNKEMEKLRGL